MASLFINIIFWSEITISFTLLVGIFFALIYFSLGFVEERIFFISRFGQILNIFVLALTMLIPFTDFGLIPFFATLIPNVLWFFVFSRGFPFIKILSFDMIGGAIFTIVAHFSWIYGFIKSEVSGYIALFCYILMVWETPLLIVITMPSIYDESGQKVSIDESRKKPKSLWSDLIPRMIESVKSFVPHAGSKLD